MDTRTTKRKTATVNFVTMAGTTPPSAPPAFKLNPYDKDLNLAVKEDEKRCNHAIDAKKSDQIYDLTSTNFENFVSRVNRKVHEYMLNRNDNFLTSLT